MDLLPKVMEFWRLIRYTIVCKVSTQKEHTSQLTTHEQFIKYDDFFSTKAFYWGV